MNWNWEKYNRSGIWEVFDCGTLISKASWHHFVIPSSSWGNCDIWTLLICTCTWQPKTAKAWVRLVNHRTKRYIAQFSRNLWTYHRWLPLEHSQHSWRRSHVRDSNCHVVYCRHKFTEILHCWYKTLHPEPTFSYRSCQRTDVNFNW
jgi:hypothetical protein